MERTRPALSPPACQGRFGRSASRLLWVTWATLGLGAGLSAVELAPLLEVGTSMSHATVPGKTRVGHQESLKEEGAVIRVVQQHASTTVMLQGGTPDAHEQILITHTGTTRYQDWLEFDNPGIFPASGSDGPIVIEFRAKIEASNGTVGIQHHIGLSGRNAASYSQTILDADRMRTPNTPTPQVGSGDWKIYRFEVYPREARVAVFIDDEPNGSFNLTTNEAEAIRTANLGFVRLYFRSMQPGKPADGAAMDGTQTFLIDWIRVLSPAGPGSQAFKTRELFAMNSRIFNASRVEEATFAEGDILRQEWSELAVRSNGAAMGGRLSTPVGRWFQQLSFSHDLTTTRATHLRMNYPYVLQTSAIRGRLVIDARLAVTAPPEAPPSVWRVGVQARSDLDGEPLLSPEILQTPAQTVDTSVNWQDFEFDYDPEREDLILRLNGSVVTRWTLPPETARKLREGNLLDVELVLYTEPKSGPEAGDSPNALVTVSFDQIRAFLAHTLISREEVQAHFAQTNNQRTHPRTLFRAADVLRLRTLIEEGDAAAVKSYGRLISGAEAMSAKDEAGNYTQPLRPWQLDEGNLRVFNIHRFSEEVGVLGLAWQLTGIDRYAQRLWDQIDVMNSYPDWGQTRHFLDTGVAMANYAIALDLIHDFLTPAQRGAMLTALREKGLQPAINGIRGNSWWSRDPNNWNAIIHGGAIMAALAFYEEDPDFMAEVIALATDAFTPYIDAFYPDGQTEEGFLYWGYGLMYATRAMEALRQVLGTDFGLSDSIGIRNTRNFPLLVTGPVATLNVGDDGIQNSRVAPNWWLARRFGDANQMFTLRERWAAANGTDWLNLAWYDPSLATGGTAGLDSLDNYLRGLEIVSHVQAWDDLNALYIAAHGGDNAASHGHLDAGSFYIQGAGSNIAYGNLGPDNYNSPGFFNNDTRPGYMETSDITTQRNAGRWHFYNLRAEGKNALVFKPWGVRADVRPDQDPNGLAIVEQVFSGEGRGFSVMNLAPVYRRDVSAYQRGIMLSSDRRVATIQDEFTPRANLTVWWNMHHGSNIALIENEGREARLFLGGSRVARMRILEPTHARFTEMRPLDYLAGSSAFPLTRNDRIPQNIRKLMIEMDVTANHPTTISVQVTVESGGFPNDAVFEPIRYWEVNTFINCPSEGFGEDAQLNILNRVSDCWAYWISGQREGLGFVYMGLREAFGWIYHAEHGWIYPAGGTMATDIMLYSEKHGWIASGDSYEGRFFRFHDLSYLEW